MKIVSPFFTLAERYRWVVWSLLVIAYAVSFFHRMSAAVVKDAITSGFGLSATEFGAMASMYFYAYCLAQIPSGLLADSVGVRLTASISTAIVAGGTIAFGLAESPSMLYISRFIVGLGVAPCFVCVLKTQSQWFREREFSTLSGACLFIGNIGSLSAQAPLALLIATLSFSGAFIFIGAGALVLAALCLLFVKNRPQDMGLPPIINVAPARSAKKERLSVTLVQVMTNKRLLLLYGFYFFSAFQFLGFGGVWSTAYLREVYALDLNAASRMASLQIIGFMIGSLLIGYLSDRRGKRKPFLVYPSLCVTLIWVAISLGGASLPLAAFAACLVAMGFFTGMFSVMMAACKEMGPRESTGTSIAAINTFGFLGIALATPAYGYVLDLFKGMDHSTQHHYATLFVTVLTAVSFLVSLGVKETNGANVESFEETRG